ncbi:LLM class flavin-dependent oxidoreductase [Jatrophihabitans sp.]|uniref:LLM class flavin-dependent oxidoreductase n=1 Tax=Jatrophihabitans sp. TaxID=1932789 RepID=UPI0030C68707
MAALKRGIAMPCFADDPSVLIDLCVAAEAAGFDGVFLWDHMTWSDAGDGPPMVDPWLVLAVVAARTERVLLGPMITPPSRRRPWVLARETTTLDVLSSGRTIFGVGLGGPDHGDFGLFGEVTDRRTRAAMLDESLTILDGLWSGEWFTHHGAQYGLGPVRFTPTPVQRPRIPIWVGGVLPNPAPIRRAARWDGAVPITYDEGGLARPSVEQITALTAEIAGQRESMDGYDVAVWAEVALDPAAVERELAAYAEAGATWWIETARPARDANWLDGLRTRISQGC